MAVAQSRCTMQRPQRPQTQGCVIVLAQSFARCETNRASTIRQPCPATVFPAQQAGYYFWCGGCENTQLAGKAWMPYKMNAQSFARCETNRAFINVQRMHDGGRTKSLHDAATPTTANARMRDSACPEFRTMRNQQSKHDSTTLPSHSFPRSTSGVLFLVRRVREHATCG